MRFQPTMVPIPSARATATLTQVGNELGRLVYLALVVGQCCVLIGSEGRVFGLLHQANRFAGHIHVVADVGLVGCPERP